MTALANNGRPRSDFTHSAELSVLAGMILEPGCVGRAHKLLQPSDFSLVPHHKIFAAIGALSDRGEKMDLITLEDELSKRGDLYLVGGVDALAQILHAATTSANLEAHAGIIREAAANREAWHVVREVYREMVKNPGTALDILRKHEAGIRSVCVTSTETRSGANKWNGIHTTTSTVTAFADIEAQPVCWLWREFVPFGMLTVLDGDPGLGKSTVTLDLAARLSRGSPMPDGSAEQFGTSLLLSAEDDMARVIRPRLEAANADARHVFSIELRNHDGSDRSPTVVAADLKEIEHVIRERDIRFVVIDPLVAFLPHYIDANRDQDVRRSLGLLRDLAERTGAAIVLVRHLRKGPADNPLYRGGGSIGIIGAARAGLLVARDPDEASGERRILAVTKTNLTPTTRSYAFRLVADPGASNPRVAWEGESDHSVAALLAVPRSEEEQGAHEEAQEFLRTVLGGGPRPSLEVIRESRAVRIAEVTLRRAKQTLGVLARKVGQPRGEGQHWVWELPPKMVTDCRTCSTLEGDHLRESMIVFGHGTDQVPEVTQHLGDRSGGAS
jgi:hypothetical protein